MIDSVRILFLNSVTAKAANLLRSAGIFLILLSAALGFSMNAAKACTSPTGVAGDIVYNTTHAMMQFCNGTIWVSMAGMSQQGCTVNTAVESGFCAGSFNGNDLIITPRGCAIGAANASACTGDDINMDYQAGNGDNNTTLLPADGAAAQTAALAAGLGDASGSIAQYCNSITIDSRSWRPPSLGEMLVIMRNKASLTGTAALTLTDDYWSSNLSDFFGNAWKVGQNNSVSVDNSSYTGNLIRCVRTIAPAVNTDPCNTTPTTYSTAGAFTYTVPAGCSSIQIQAFGAGGGGDPTNGARGGGGGGAASGVVQSSTLLIAGGGGGGGGGENNAQSLGGGGGYATGIFSVSSGASLDVYVGAGGSNSVGNTGGDGGTAGGNSALAGTRGGDRRAPATAGANYGGAGGGGEEDNGANAIYGGAGGRGNGGGVCGTSTNGGACSTEDGGGGGGYADPSATSVTTTLGSNGSTGAAANSGPGTGGGTGSSAAGSGRVVITPQG